MLAVGLLGFFFLVTVVVKEDGEFFELYNGSLLTSTCLIELSNSISFAGDRMEILLVKVGLLRLVFSAVDGVLVTVPVYSGFKSLIIESGIFTIGSPKAFCNSEKTNAQLLNKK